MLEETNQKTLKNRSIFCGDCLDVMRGINSNSIDLIYLDPPFNKKKQFVAPIGSGAEGAEFKDYWGMEDIKDAWLVLLKEKHKDLYTFIELSGVIGDKSNKYYLVYMAMRLIEMKRILKDTGSIYLHCDNTMGHLLKLLLDVLFGHKNFRNALVWHYFKPHGGNTNYPNNYDTIFFYTKSKDYFFNYEATFTSYDEKAIKRYDKIDEQGKHYKIYNNKDGSTRIAYLKQGKSDNVLEIPFVQGTSNERVGYPTQKPIKLLERIISASCPSGGVVLDPFCGCATTCVASEKLGMKWVGIDISRKAFELVNIRLRKEVANPEELFQHKNTLIFREDIPERTDIEKKKLIGRVKSEIKTKLYGVQAGNCAGCGQHFHIIHMELDHKIARAIGGSDNEDNLQLLCSYCNRVKGDKPMEYLLSKIAEVRKNMP